MKDVLFTSLYMASHISKERNYDRRSNSNGSPQISMI